MDSTPDIAIIGGSGLYEMQGLNGVRQVEVDTPFGKPSAPIAIGELEGRQVAFLARHGLGHSISPSELNSRANIFALKQLGVDCVVSISACGSLREDYTPGDIVIPDQLFDFTRGRKRTFFEDGLVAHLSAADPFCPNLSRQLFRAVENAGGKTHFGGSLITIEGPRFSTRVESNVFRSWGMSIIGMTSSPEAFLAREAEMCYAVMAHVTDYDVWHVSENPVTVEMVIEVLHRNTRLAQEAVRILVRNLEPRVGCECPHALASAIITQPSAIPAATRQRLEPLVGKYLR